MVAARRCARLPSHREPAMSHDPPPTRSAASQPFIPQADAVEEGMSASPPNGGTLLRRAHAALRAQGHATPTASLVGEVFGVEATGAAAGPWVTMLDSLLRRSPLFALDRRGGWSLAEWDAGRRQLADLEWAV